MKHFHHVSQSCLRRCIEGISEVDVGLIDSPILSVVCMPVKMYLFHVHVDTLNLPSPALPWF